MRRPTAQTGSLQSHRPRGAPGVARGGGQRRRARAGAVQQEYESTQDEAPCPRPRSSCATSSARSSRSPTGFRVCAAVGGTRQIISTRTPRCATGARRREALHRLQVPRRRGHRTPPRLAAARVAWGRVAGPARASDEGSAMPRSIWSGAISCGLVNVPVRMHSGKRAQPALQLRPRQGRQPHRLREDLQGRGRPGTRQRDRQGLQLGGRGVRRHGRRGFRRRVRQRAGQNHRSMLFATSGTSAAYAYASGSSHSRRCTSPTRCVPSIRYEPSNRPRPIRRELDMGRELIDRLITSFSPSATATPTPTRCARSRSGLTAVVDRGTLE